MKFVNLTPHDVSIQTVTGTVITVPISGMIARVNQSVEPFDCINGIEIARVNYGAISNLPDPESDTIYIVSLVVAQAVRNRQDIVYPDSGPSAIRENGQIKYVKRFLTT